LETITVLAYLCVRERFRPGDMLFNQGEADGNAMYVVSGKGTLLHQNDGGRHEVGPVCPGRFLGGLTLLSDTPRLFSLRADEEMVCLILSREKFGKTQEQFPVVMPRIVEMLVKEINIFEQAVLDKTQALEENHEYFGVSLI
jgi:CRP-like cAMP-binding protein